MGDSVKISVYGAIGAGKSTMLVKMKDGIFETDYDSTLENTFRKVVKFGKNEVKLEIQDTAGEDDLAPIEYGQIKDYHALIFCYSITDRSSFEKIPSFIQALEKKKGPIQCPVCICGCKCDLDTQRAVTKYEGEQFAKKMNALFYETSAKTDANLEIMFNKLTKCVIKKSGKGGKGCEIY